MKTTVSLTQNKLAQILEAVKEAEPNSLLSDAIQRIRNDKEFFDEIIRNLGIKRNKEKNYGILNVFETDNLCDKLKQLEINQLFSIVKENRLDTSNKVVKWKNRKNVEDFILKRVTELKNQTAAFK